MLVVMLRWTQLARVGDWGKARLGVVSWRLEGGRAEQADRGHLKAPSEDWGSAKVAHKRIGGCQLDPGAAPDSAPWNRQWPAAPPTLHRATCAGQSAARSIEMSLWWLLYNAAQVVALGCIKASQSSSLTTLRTRPRRACCTRTVESVIRAFVAPARRCTVQETVNGATHT